MSTLQNSHVWPVTQESLDSKHEKCRNITEEIYKRINITFQIKKLEAPQSDVSDHSDQIDSNELSNETDLFACDKSDSISSSTEAEKPVGTCEKYININNNEETKLKKNVVVYKRPRKRFRKRVKKRQNKPTHSDSDGSSDEALPLSRIVDVDTKCKSEESGKSEPDHVMGVPKIVILTKDLKPKIHAEKKTTDKKDDRPVITAIEKTIDKPETNTTELSASNEKCVQVKHCTMCSLTFRGERGLRRHMSMSHSLNADANTKMEQREVKPA